MAGKSTTNRIGNHGSHGGRHAHGAPHLDAAELKRAANGRWQSILAAAGIPSEILDGQHYPCPRCGGHDRWRFSDVDGDGSVLCNQCGRDIGDGLAALMWWRSDLDALPAAINFAAGVIGVGGANGQASGHTNGAANSTSTSNGNAANGTGTPNGHSPSQGKHGRPPANPEENLDWKSWNDAAAKLFFCRAKKGVTVEALKAFGARMAVYRKRYQVIALPVRSAAGEVVGWCLFEQSGKTLPAFHGKNRQPTQEKMLLTAGSKAGIIAPDAFFDGVGPPMRVWKVEGPTDALALWAAAGEIVGIFTNSNGARQNPLTEWLPLVAGRDLVIIHDADQPGEDGAAKWVRACVGLPDTVVRNPKLPYAIEPSHGKDLRDWLNASHSFKDLLDLAKAAPPIAADALPALSPIEAEDDPHRLARLFLAEQTGSVIFWRRDYYRWSGECYRSVADEQIDAELTFSIKREFDRLNLLDQEDGAASENGRPKECRQVSGAKVGNAKLAVNSLVIVGSDKEPPEFMQPIEKSESGSSDTSHADQPSSHCISLANGILDLDALLSGAELADVLLAHTPKFFTLNSLPFPFVPEADIDGTRWLNTLSVNQEGDEQRMAILQEWAGYLLLPNTSEQKFLILEGEGANGKSVFCAGIEALLGLENVSHVPLELFGQRFALTTTLHKLANVAADCGEIDKVAEGFLKSFTAGDRMMFDRKGKPPVEAFPTARLMLATNNRPRFSDRSGGLWRRMILVPWRREVPENERIKGMDKPEYWLASGELPAMLNWAIDGLARLREQGGFTRSELVEEGINEYRIETNPARQFLLEHVKIGETWMPCAELYAHYAEWCKANGYHKINENNFGREVRRVFKEVKTEQYRDQGQRHRRYVGIFYEQEIFQ